MAVFILFALAVLGAVHSYLAWHLWQGVRYVFPRVPLKAMLVTAGLLLMIMAAGFMRSRLPVGAEIRHALGMISTWWMGVMAYGLLYCLLADLIIVPARVLHLIPAQSRKLVRFVSGMLIVGLTAGTVLYGVVHADHPKHVTYDVQLTGYEASSEMNIVMISDLHLGAERSERRLQKIVEEINAVSPDLVLIAGDFFDSDYGAIRDPEKAAALLRTLQAPYGVYACLGNHDAGATYPQMKRFLEDSQIRLLADEAVVIDGRIQLVGRLDGSPIGGYGGQRRKAIGEILLPEAASLPVVVLEHNPAQADGYRQGADLLLCGHTHKGQLFPGSLVTRKMYTVDHGYYRRDENSPHVIVTSGVGTWGPPMRVGTDSEINQIRLAW